MMRRADVNGVTLAYDLAGQGSGVPVAFLNGVAMSIGNWRPLVPLLGGRQVLLHDFRGQLLSSSSAGPYSLGLHAEDLAALMDHLGVARVHLAGTSYGSEVAMEFALAFPERTASLTVIAGAADCEPLLRAAIESWKAAALSDPRVFFRCTIPWNYSSGYIAKNAEALAQRESAVAALPREWFLSFVALCDAFLAIDLLPRLDAINVPTLVLAGELDILKHSGYSARITDAIPGAEYAMIPGAGHAAVIERPDFIAAVLRDFLDRVESSRPDQERRTI